MQLVVAAAGAALGSLAGPGIAAFGLTGAQLGWMAGGILGGLLFQPTVKQQGPRLDDLKVASSTYGSVIPYLIGTSRVAGSIVWASDKREIATTTSQGGKGGGGVESTSYTYEIDLLIKLTSNPCDAILRIFSDGKLLWTGRSDAGSANLVSSDEITKWNRLTFYKGSSSQLPDPTYEAAVGVGNAPAYRGCSTVFIESLQLGSSGQLPNLTFEISQSASTSSSVTNYTPTFQSPISAGGLGPINRFPYTFHGENYSYYLRVIGSLTVATTFQVYRYDVKNNTNTIITNNYQPPNAVQHYDYVFDGGVINSSDDIPRLLHTFWYTPTQPSATITYYVTRFDENLSSFPLFTFVGAANGADMLNCESSYISYDHVTDRYVMTEVDFALNKGSKLSIKSKSQDSYLTDAVFSSTLPSTCGNHAFYNNIIYIIYNPTTGADAGKSFIQLYTGGGGGYDYRTGGDGDFTFPEETPGVLIGTTEALPYAVSLKAVVKASAKGLFIWDRGNTYDTVLQYSDLGVTTGTWKTIFRQTGISESRNIDSFGIGSVIKEAGSAFITDTYFRGSLQLGGSTGNTTQKVYYATAANTKTISTVISELCSRSGLSSIQIDVTGTSGITRPVRGYVVSQVTDTRTVLEALANIYFFDASLSDKLYFRSRGRNTAVTIPYEKLGVQENSGNQDSLIFKQVNDLEVPARSSFTFNDIDADYEPNTQYSDRMLSVQDTVNAVNIPVVLTASEGKAVVDALNTDIASQFLSTTVTVSGHYTAYEPGDPVLITDSDGSTYRMRIVKCNRQPSHITWDLVLDDASVFTQSGITTATSGAQVNVTGKVKTKLLALDIPILRDSDSDYGLYVATSGSEGYTGSFVYTSNDNVSYEAQYSLTDNCIIGGCLTTLGSWTGNAVFDETNVIEVWIYSGTLSSVNRSDILNSRNTNLALIGNELIQFTNATLINTNQYRLSGLLRGRRGTEAYMTGHAVAERFVLLSTSGVRRDQLEFSDLGQLRYYKGVTFETKLSDAETVTVTPAGRGFLTYSPTDIRINNSSTDLVISWKPRTRKSYTFCGLSGISVPTGETTEEYDIEIYDASFTTLYRTITGNTTSSYTYTLANRTTDFTILPANIGVRVYQTNDQLGRGQSASAVLPTNNVTNMLLLHMDGTNGGTTFTDSSAAPRTVTPTATTTITGDFRFGTACASFTGASYLSVSGDSSLETNNWTIECYFKATAWHANVNTIASQWTGAGNYMYIFYAYSSGLVYQQCLNGNSGNAQSCSKVQALSLNTWYHMAVVRVGNVMTCYIDGVAGTPVTINAISGSTLMQTRPAVALNIGRNGEGGGTPGLYWNHTGYIDEFRITKSAVYLGNFTPPQAPFI